MSAATLIEAWADTLVTTALLVLAILAIRKPFARHFGPRLTYMLWLVPALRLVLPPLPIADPVAAPPPVAVEGGSYLIVVDAAAAAEPVAAPLWTFADVAPYLVAVWAAGMAAVLAAALVAHGRFRREVLADAVELEPIGSIRLVMSDAVDGPVAFGLWRRVVAVPQDFFTRYVADERALAIDHELAHHRHGDLWANAAALILLASQWFNPFAWRAIRAFRFDQEAACDARVLTMHDTAPRELRTARYATAIAKAAVGSRLSLAAPMAVHDNLQERLLMLTHKDISRERGLIGRLLVGGTTVAVLATTATLVPAGMAQAGVKTIDPVDAVDVPAPPALPPAPDAPPSPEAPAAPGEQRVMIFTSTDEETSEGDSVSDDVKRRDVQRVVVRHKEAHDAKAPKDRLHAFRMPGSLSREEILSTLKEQGVTGAQAEGIADKLEAKRKEGFTAAFAPMPPMPPMAPVAWSSANGKSFTFSHCGGGKKAVPLVDRKDEQDGKRSHVVMMSCGEPAANRAARLSALKKARENFDKARSAQSLSEEIRAKVAADLDKAIADLERSGE